MAKNNKLPLEMTLSLVGIIVVSFSLLAFAFTGAISSTQEMYTRASTIQTPVPTPVLSTPIPTPVATRCGMPCTTTAACGTSYVCYNGSCRQACTGGSGCTCPVPPPTPSVRPTPTPTPRVLRATPRAIPIPNPVLPAL